ncbi:MAG: tryptophan synthase subunit alpha [Simkaniaceae bacterium]|nr:tryptophan synthase subunit alpha [Simkaniaceae bacterium]
MQYIGYLCADEGTVEMALALVKGGVDYLEIGIPFSDPVADGPVIQDAATLALSHGMTSRKVLEIVRKIREKTEVPIILFTYLNPLLSAGERYLQEAYLAGVTGILVVDLPLEAAETHIQQCRQIGLDTIFVIAPSTTGERIRKICEACRGFVYYACRKGTTGERSGLPENLALQIKRIKQETELPVAVGFGISSQKDVKAVLKVADAAVVGSKFVKAVLEGAKPEDLTHLAQSLYLI